MSNNPSGRPIPFFTVGIVLLLIPVSSVILKLCGAITWSWFWVLFPFILAFGVWIMFFIIVFILITLGFNVSKR